MERTEKSSGRGRPRGFDRQAALETMVRLFWSQGYENTQISDIVATIGIAPPSFYAAFKSKEAAFKEAVDLYLSTVGAKPILAMNEADGIVDAMRNLLHESIEVALSCSAGGCLLVTGAMTGPPASKGARDHLRAARSDSLTLIRDRIDRAVSEGELPLDTASQDLARFYLGMMQAISFQARDGASKTQLLELVRPALQSLMHRS